MIAGFDAAVNEMEVGEIRKVRLAPEEAYGERRDDLVNTFPISSLPGAENLTAGLSVMLASPSGQPIPARVVEKTDETVTLDMNPEMAGKTLNFEIELLEVEG